MFCFKCGERMIIKNQVHYCAKGDMYLSPKMDERLSGVFEDKNEKTLPKNIDEIPPQRFFCLNVRCRSGNQIYSFAGDCRLCGFRLFEITAYCPECGVPMKHNSAEPFDISCVVCGKNLREFYYRLTEFHPHKPYAKDFHENDLS